MEIVYIILGWLFGLLSPSIIKKIFEGKERENLKKIIFNDLKELKKRLAPLPFIVYPKYGKLDKKTFDWLKINSDIDFSKGLEEIIKKEGLSESQILHHLNNKGLQDQKSTYFKKIHLFTIDSNLINFSLIDNNLMERLLEIKFYVEAFNEDLDNFRENLKMTFLPGITNINHEIISQEMKKQSLMIADRSIFIVNKINYILSTSRSKE